MALNKDSAVVILRSTSDGGYFVQAFMWPTSPPPIGTDLATAIDRRDGNEATVRQDRIAVDKAELITEFTNFVNEVFDQEG